ncbi:hypothetical protein K1719_042124 [Acacia pycnantha]|nr:hypothetical protein K1719_042124 [Acacia pycnantha]
MIKEVEMTRKIRHQNVARSLGSWIGDEYGLTISRYVENGSLHDVLHENNPLPYLTWNIRYKIAFGIAKGLAYLHHDFDPPILHRDIKPKNILLDSDMQPYITDFEIAHVIAPGCELDIHSYGVVLLELITRKKVLDDSFVEEETTLKDPRKRLKMIDIVEFYETPTDPGILVRHDNDSFHLGNFVLTALASLFFQEEVKIPANEGSFSALDEGQATAEPDILNIIRRGTRGVVSKVQTYSGCSIQKDYVVIRYEYLENGNLHDLLHEKNPPPPLNWAVCYQIATGIEHGLAYLHYRCYPAVVHCAIKPKNILLDFDMEPHIADFNSAKLLDGYSLMPLPSSSILGRLGYITPENTRETAITREFDVYNYGVVLLQLITRKKTVDQSFMRGSEIGVRVRSLWRESGDIFKIVDSSLVKELLNAHTNVFEQVTKVLSMALSCTDEDPGMRPTMTDVIKELVR